MIYIHIPFCRSFCTYCDFYSEVAARCRKADEVFRQEVMFGEYAEAVSAELLSRAGEITRDVNTLYIGGGTPSVLPLSAFRRIADTLESIGYNGPYEEFTVEVNPEDIVEKGQSYVEGLLEIGVNRISMGVQSFDDGILRFMNRRHDAATAVSAYAVLEEAGVRNISIDLIFGLPQLSSSKWKETLDRALNISRRGNLPHHVSSYQLSVEPGSALAALVERGQWQEASEDLCREQYSILCDTLRSAGYDHYEISNFALPGFEARHNSAYWLHLPYVGVGPGAHSFLPSGHGTDRDCRKWNQADLAAYLDAAGKGDFSAVQGGEYLSSEQLSLERLMLGLRTGKGLPVDFLLANCSREALDRAIAAGNLVEVPAGHESQVGATFLRIPESRFFISDSVIAGLV